MRGLVTRRLWLLFALVFFLLMGRLPQTRFRLEQVSAAAPVANNDTYNAVVGVVLIVPAPGFLGNDTDSDSDPLTVDPSTFIELPPLISSLSYNGDGSFQYLASSAGTDVYQYQATDGTSNSNTATITFHVDTPPVAFQNSYTTTVNTPLTITASEGVLNNDSDAENDPLTAVLVDQPAHGTVTLNTDGSFSYTPNTGFGGSDSFTYQADDGVAKSSVATVFIKVDRAPVALDDIYETPTHATLTVAAIDGVLNNDSDADGDVLTAVVRDRPSHGTLNVNNFGAFSYVPAADYFGLDSFTYQVSDSTTKSNIATVTIHVGHAQPLGVDDAYSMKRNTTLTVAAAQGVLANDTDADGDVLTAVVRDRPSHGTLTLNATNGSFTYTPDINFVGTDIFTYRANDGTANSNLATVRIQVNHAPVAAANAYAVNPNAVLNVAAPGILDNDTDADGDALTVRILTVPLHGVVVLNADGSLTYTPEADFVGTDGFTYQANDGAQDSNVAPVTIRVAPLSTAADDSYFTTINTVLEVTAPGVLENDVGDMLIPSLVTGVTNGTLTINDDGSFTYTPDSTFTGTDHFTYKANDGTFESNEATVTIHVISTSPTGAAPERNYFTALPIILTWNRVSSAVGYEVQVSTSPTFAGTPVVDKTTDTPYLSLPSLANGHYYWRVRSTTAGSSWSTVDSFTVST